MKNNIENKRIRITRLCYIAGWGIVVCAAIGIVLANLFDFQIVDIIPLCDFHTITGYYCFGCGGTRSVNALLHGSLLKSLYYHPFPLYMTTLFVLFMGTYTLSQITGGRVKMVKLRPVYFYVLIVIVILQCVVKNYLVYRYGFVL